MPETTAHTGVHQLREDMILIETLFAGRIVVREKVIHQKTVGETIVAQVVAGTYEVTFRGSSHTIRPGEVVVVPAGVPVEFVHHPDPRRGYMEARWLHLHATLLGAVDFLSLYDLPPRLDRKQSAPVGAIIAELLRDDAEGLAGALRRVCHRSEYAFRLLGLLAELGSLKASAMQRLGHHASLESLFRQIRFHLAAPLDVGQLAAWAGLSPSRLHAVFQARLGLTPMAYVRRLRLAEARRLLAATDMPVAEVAAATGFASPFHFSRLFRAEARTSPSGYRSQMRA